MKVASASRQATSRGGQASLGLFGVPGFDARWQQSSGHPCTSRIKGALNPSDRDGLSPAHCCPLSASAPMHRPSLHDEPELAHGLWLADLAEARGCPFDEEAAAYARSFAGVGYAEHLMALD